MAAHGKRYGAALAAVDRSRAYAPAEAVALVKETSKAKFDESSVQYKGTRSVLAELEPELEAKVKKVALDAYRALRVRDYGRIDLRLTSSGEIYVIEVNANCYLLNDGEFAMAAAADGLDYPALIGRIVEFAMERQGQRLGTRKKRKSHK